MIGPEDRQLWDAATSVASRPAWAGTRAGGDWALGCAMLAVVLFAGYVTVQLGVLLVDLASVKLFAATQNSGTPSAAVPEEPIAAIIDAFRTHNVVALSDPHGVAQVQAFLLALIRDPRFPAAVNDIVIETASARYQDAIDRFIRGDEVSYAILRKAWEDHTVVNNGLSGRTEEMIRAVRTVNASLDEATRLRVIAGDPPIDWDNVITAQDHRRWIELRDSYPADLIRRQVLDRGRRALVIYGQGHLQRRQIVSNYDMSTWQAETLVSLLERDPGVRVFNVWTLKGKDAGVPEGFASWRVPSLVVVHGTILGAMDFGLYNGGLGDGTRFAVRDGQLVPIARAEWKTMRLEDEFSALLYLGPQASTTDATIPVALCHDAQFTNTRLQRLARFAPPVELTNFKKACGL